MLPIGFKFNPTDEELIQILENKVAGSETLHFIIEANIYDHEPQDIKWDPTVGVSNKERYYFCKRANDSREVAGRGWWKATSHVKAINDGHGRVFGYKKPMTFHRFREVINGNGKRTNPIKTDWIMHEFSLPSPPSEWKLCKIKRKGKGTAAERVERDDGREMKISGLEACSSSNYTREQLLVQRSAMLDQPVCEVGHVQNELMMMDSHSPLICDQSHMEPLTDTLLYDQFGQLYSWDQQPDQFEQPFSDLWS